MKSCDSEIARVVTTHHCFPPHLKHHSTSFSCEPAVDQTLRLLPTNKQLTHFQCRSAGHFRYTEVSLTPPTLVLGFQRVILMSVVVNHAFWGFLKDFLNSKSPNNSCRICSYCLSMLSGFLSVGSWKVTVGYGLASLICHVLLLRFFYLLFS